MASLDEIRGNRRGLCFYCDNEADTYIEVRVRERKGDKKQVTSRSVSACNEHTVMLFKDIEKQIERKR
jgi:hypothetical protein